MPFRVPSLDDPRLEELVRLYREAGISFGNQFDDFVEDEDPNRKFNRYTALLLLISTLFRQSEAWAAGRLNEIINDADREAVRAVIRVQPSAVLSPSVDPSARSTVLNSTVGHLFKARTLIDQNLGKVFRSLDLSRDFFDIATAIRTGDSSITPEALDRKIRRALSKQARETPVVVVSAGGRLFRYPLDYYAAMVVHNAKFQAESLVAVSRALEAGLDLVQISNQPSIHGDWCDAYRGKVFSITGRTPGFPTLAQTPNNGAPFHPWCRHTMKIFDPAGKSQEELRSLGDVDQRFLLSQNNDFNSMVRAWWKSRR